MRTVVITGGTGLVGSALSAFLVAGGCRVIVLTRGEGHGAAPPGMHYAHWDPARGTLDAYALAEADAIVHLAGEPIMTGRWSREKKAAIRSSRVAGAVLLARSLERLPHRVGTLVSASGIAYYGDGAGRIRSESDPAGTDFLAGVCAGWENAARAAAGVRVVILRTPPVLAANAPLLTPLTNALKLGIAPVPGTGEAWFSWIHIRDLVRIYGIALEDTDFTGVYNAVSPFPVTMGQLSTTLAHTIKGRFVIPVYIPPVLIRAAAGEKGRAMLASIRVSAARLLRTGFEFSFPTLGGALEDLYGKK